MSDSLRRKISSEAAQLWSLPIVEGPIVGRRTDPANTRDRDRERERERERQRLEQEAIQAGHARGYEEGLARGRAEINAKIAELTEQVKRLDSILQFLAHPLSQLDTQVERQLTLLALAVGRQLARRELKTDPGQIIAIIREAVGRLPAAARDVRVHLHPEDAAMVRERLAAPGGAERAWTIVEDPTLSRGGCLVRSESSQVDARLENRVNAVVSNILGDERASSRTESNMTSDNENADARAG